MNFGHVFFGPPGISTMINKRSNCNMKSYKEMNFISDLFSSKDGHGIDILWINDPGKKEC